MTTLYRSVLIESAEQAEALPIGTVATHDAHMPLEKWSDPEEGATWGYLDESIEHADLVGWTALVPIEAEEEARVTPEALTAAAQQTLARANRAAATGMLPPDRLTIQQQIRYVTPWRDAQ